MKDRIEQLQYRGRNRDPRCHVVETINSEYIYVVDYTNHNRGKVMICDTQPEDIGAVIIDNTQGRIEVHYDAFLDHALKIRKEKSEKQCECFLFPSSMNDEDWMLFIETKYTDSEYSAQQYPSGAVDQIGKTVLFLREKGIIGTDKEVHGIISFPQIQSPFTDMYWNTGDAYLKKTEYALDDIYIEISNTATIHSATELEITK